jgi:hypothetical protein
MILNIKPSDNVNLTSTREKFELECLRTISADKDKKLCQFSSLVHVQSDMLTCQKIHGNVNSYAAYVTFTPHCISSQFYMLLIN